MASETDMAGNVFAVVKDKSAKKTGKDKSAKKTGTGIRKSPKDFPHPFSVEFGKNDKGEPIFLSSDMLPQRFYVKDEVRGRGDSEMLTSNDLRNVRSVLWDVCSKKTCDIFKEIFDAYSDDSGDEEEGEMPSAIKESENMDV